MANSNFPINVGDRVAFSRAWLRSTGHFTGEVPFLRGVVRDVVRIGSGFDVPAIVTVAWDGAHEQRVLACNLVRVDRIPFEPV
jgi:hypothetical protein